MTPAKKSSRSSGAIPSSASQANNKPKKRAVTTQSPGIFPPEMDEELKSLNALQPTSAPNLRLNKRRQYLEALRLVAGLKIEYMPHPSFEGSSREVAEILSPMPRLERPPRKTKPPEGLPPYLSLLYDTPLLTREQEFHLFRKMNFLFYRASTSLLALKGRPTQRQLDEIIRLYEEAEAVKNQIIKANLRLVVSIAKKHIGEGRDFFELVSDGNISLIRAVAKFDFARGNKLSTYASWAIVKNFIRSLPQEIEHRRRFTTGLEDFEEVIGGKIAASSEEGGEARVRRSQEVVQEILGKLDDRERRILIARFGIGGAMEKTLEQLGRELGVTKERIRQLEERAMTKLRKIARSRAVSDPEALLIGGGLDD